jgi:hypothetical protein
MFLQAAPSQRLVDLQRSLNDAIRDDKPIELVEGNDFEGPPGTVIFTSRADGAARLVALARAGHDETSLFYLPQRKAWVTEAVVRTPDITSADTRYCEAAMQSEPVVELWHFHNNIGTPDGVGDLTPLQVSMMWSVPSALDLEELYAWAEQEPKAKFRGFVANIYGVVEYWSDEYSSEASPFYLKQILLSEARLVKMKAKDATVGTLGRVLRSHRGAFWYRFTPIP